MAIRKNASLESVALATFHRAVRAHKVWWKWVEANRRRAQVGHVEFADRCRESDAADHRRELEEIAKHLLRLIGKSEGEIETMWSNACHGTASQGVANV